MWHYFGENHQTEPTYIMAPKTTRGWQQNFLDIKAAILMGMGACASLDRQDLLRFTLDEDVIVYIAYERLGRLFSSTIPEWLQDFEKEEGDQTSAQYHYSDVYSKRFPAGEIILPGADAASHNVMSKYFIIIKKQ